MTDVFTFSVPKDEHPEALNLTIEVTPALTNGRCHTIEYVDPTDELAYEPAELDAFDKGQYFRYGKLLERGAWTGRFIVQFPYTVIGSEILTKLKKFSSLRAEPPYNPSALVTSYNAEQIRKYHNAYWQHLSVNKVQLEALILELSEQMLLEAQLVARVDVDRLRELPAAVASLFSSLERFRRILAGATAHSEEELVRLYTALDAQRQEVERLHRSCADISLNIERTVLANDVALHANAAFNEARGAVEQLQHFPTAPVLLQETELARAAWSDSPAFSGGSLRHLLADELVMLARKFPVCSCLSATPQGDLVITINGVRFTNDGQEFSHEGDLGNLLVRQVAKSTGTSTAGSRLARLGKK